MRTLLLMRGAPGVGKSTFIEKNNLKKYTLCADDIRLLIQTPLMQTDGSFAISQNNDDKVWSTLFNILEDRMKRGEFTVIDATNSKTKEMTRYRDLAKAYRYRMYCVDFTDVPIEVCKQRNSQRPEYKQVPEDVIDKIYSRFEGQKIPRDIEVIKPDELDKILIKPIDVSEYKKIHYIGDIHGCYTALKQAIPELKDDELYVFCGDYIDRGIENAEVLNFLIEICEKPNVCLIEGNHDRAIYDYAHDLKTGKKQFDDITYYELKQANVDKKQLRILYRKIRQCAYYNYNSQLILATHAGISKMPENLVYLPTDQMIKGVGTYGEMKQVCENWKKSNPDIIQVFGHRNVEDNSIKINDCCYNLEGNVEFGGFLRMIDINQDLTTFETYSKNDIIANEQNSINEQNKKELDIDDVIENMRKSSLVSEKKTGNISAFNFSERAFKKGLWDDVTTKARGLFINTNTKQIVARSYDKFFRINETAETQTIYLKSKFAYPLNVYVKYNGFLGILGYDKESDELLITSKSSLDGEHVGYLKDLLKDKDLDAIKEYLKENNSSMVFEAIDIKNDPHIIKYNENKLVLLDVIKNDLKFEKLNYKDLKTVGAKFDFEVKELAYTLNSIQEFWDWYYKVQEEDFQYKNEYVEGFVIEDANSFMVKVKLDYYNTWKFMRGVFQKVKKMGYINRTSTLTTKLHNDFYNWCVKNKDNLPEDIISAREAFENEK